MDLYPSSAAASSWFSNRPYRLHQTGPSQPTHLSSYARMSWYFLGCSWAGAGIGVRDGTCFWGMVESVVVVLFPFVAFPFCCPFDLGPVSCSKLLLVLLTAAMMRVGSVKV